MNYCHLFKIGDYILAKLIINILKNKKQNKKIDEAGVCIDLILKKN